MSLTLRLHQICNVDQKKLSTVEMVGYQHSAVWGLAPFHNSLLTVSFVAAAFHLQLTMALAKFQDGQKAYPGSSFDASLTSNHTNFLVIRTSPATVSTTLFHTS